MNYRLFKYGILVLAAILSNSCEKDVKNVDLPPFEKKLAIASFISPSDSGILVYVSSNQRLYGDLSLKEEPGLLSGTISDGSKEVILDTSTDGLYVSCAKMPIQYGMTYHLMVKNDKGLSAEASCTIPEKRDFDISIDSITYVTHTVPIDEHQNYIYYTKDFQLSIADYPGEKNFYRMKAIWITYKTDSISGIQYKTFSDLYLGKEFFTDKGVEGSRIIYKGSINYFSSYYSDFDSTLLKIYLYNTEESYYRYHTSLTNYNDGENPFTEVTPVYSNVTGGLGVFTSFTVDSLVYQLK